MADSIFSGLDSFGLGGLGEMDLYGEKKEEKKAPVKKPEPVKKVVEEDSEKNYLLDRTITCPCCDNTFKYRAVKSSVARLVGSDNDLRPRHNGIDVTKYDAIVCPMCGYAALSRYFPNLLKLQREAIQEKISCNFKTRPGAPETYTYDEAIEMYKLTLVNAVVKNAKASEKAYICLKTSWLYRGKAEELGEGHPDYEATKANEFEFTKNAYEGFVAAVASESFPMCGMDEMTVNYLMANLAVMTEHYDVASKLISTILTSFSASSRVKDKTRELKEEVIRILRGNGK
ncbi:MAG: DUF2225 domain-containing protein [Lachnospiraceae bacterium]|nr:DUF2225 domain-containing protein [Lachnospiraceae bacterium]